MRKGVVSVVLPIYNVEKYLNRCVKSVVNQSYKNLEIILVDDGSPDNCPTLCEDWAKKDSRIKVVHKKNAGLGYARNTGIENATGEYICFFDSDDYIALDAIEKAYSLAVKEKSDMYKGLEEYGYITGRSLLIKGISLVALFLFVKTRQDYVAYALISSLATGGNYIFNVIHAKKFVRFDFSSIRIQKHIKPVLLIACIIFLSSIYNKIDVTMLNMMATDESVGFYSYAQKTINMVLTMANAVTAALLPRLSYYYDNDREGFYRLLDKGFQILCVMTLPLAVGMALVAYQTVQFLYGEAFAPAALTIQLMCPLILIKGFGDLFCYQLVYSTKSEKIILPAAASASAINVITNAILIPMLLQNGAVIASVLSELVTNAIQFIYMKKKVRFSINGKALVTGLFSTAIMSVSVLMLMQLRLPNTVGLFIEVACGAIVYTAVNMAMKNALIFEIIEKIKSKILCKN